MSRVRIVLGLTISAFLLALPAAGAGGGWVEVDYAELVDGREPTHSGEAVSGLLRRLAGRPVPRGKEIQARPDDLLTHVLLDPVLERYAFVLPDAVDRIDPPGPDAPHWYEPADLWEPGEAEPAWVELLRARRYVALSDGGGRMRLFLPLPEGFDTAAGGVQEGAEQAWREHWPVIRHVLRSEQVRLAGEGRGGNPDLDVEVYGYRHLPARSVFVLGVPGIRKSVGEAAADPAIPSLDFAAWQRFLETGRTLEGARLEPDGSIRFLTSDTDRRPEILGAPITLADMAVAYRAVFHGGLGDPYMSLDRGYSPQTTIVNYGGRLRDTRLGMVALLCDIRFKTISVGMDIWRGEDIRGEIRRSLPEFMTHVERFAADPAARGVLSQQTRLWFYPDEVDMTVSDPGDVVVLRSVRMSAASERLTEAGFTEKGGTGDPPWTRETVATVNRRYDRLAGLFPELADLDQVVRLLSFFTWLKVARDEGLPVPDLDALLAVELPPYPTPRTFPQMLAFHALPPAGAPGEVEVLARLEVGEGLDRLSFGDGRPLPAGLRYRRAVEALDPQREEDLRLLEEMKAYRPEDLDDASLDFFSYRAERIQMHRLVLSTLPQERGADLIRRNRAGEALRLFSVGIGGLDLGMNRVVREASGRSLGFGAAGRSAGEVRRFRSEPAVPAFRGPEPPPVPARSFAGGDNRYEVLPGERRVLTAADSPGVRRRSMMTSGEGGISFLRYENRRETAYRIDRDGNRLVAKAEALPRAAAPAPGGAEVPPAGMLTLSLASAADPGRVRVVIRNPAGRPMAAELPRRLLQSLVLGPRLDPRRGPVLPGLWPPAKELGAADRVLLVQGTARRMPPWQAAPEPLPGEEDAVTVAGSMVRWAGAFDEPSFPAVAVATSSTSAGRWAAAPAPGGRPVLLAPGDALSGPAASYAGPFREAWRAGPVVAELPAEPDAGLVVLVSSEPPGVLARRLRRLAADRRMEGRALLVWSLGGRLREDLPASLLEEGRLAALGLMTVAPVDWRTVYPDLARLSAAFGERPPSRLDDLPVPAVWFY